jgi:hypothetical protein
MRYRLCARMIDPTAAGTVPNDLVGQAGSA